MRRGSLLACVLALALAGCGGGAEGTDDAATTATTVAPTTPATAASEQVAAGERVVVDAGCLACHQIGGEGQSGPGSNLDGIGDRMPPSTIRRSLINSPAPMPSYRQLPRDRLDAIVAYLSSLRGDCPDGSDCG